MRKIFAVLLLTAATFAAKACWFNEENFHRIYIAGVNNFVPHTVFDTAAPNDFTKVIYKNNQIVPLPLTPWFVIMPLNDDDGTEHKIVLTRLYYRLVKKTGQPTGYWTLLKEFNNPVFPLNFATPVSLFGKNIIHKNLSGLSGINPGDKIQLLWYCVGENGLSNAFEPWRQYPQLYPGNEEDFATMHEWDYTPPYVFQIIWDGKTTPQ